MPEVTAPSPTVARGRGNLGERPNEVGRELEGNSVGQTREGIEIVPLGQYVEESGIDFGEFFNGLDFQVIRTREPRGDEPRGE